jgi:hypothetical protein
MLGILRFPLWLISRLFGKRKRRVREERKEKQRKYVRNFSQVNYSWQVRSGKKMSEGQKEWRRKRRKGKKDGKFGRKKTNNFSEG